MGIKQSAKDIAKEMFYRLGICGPLLRISCICKYPAFFILAYHRTCPSGNGRPYMATPIDIFEQHIKFIKDNFKIMPMTEGLKNIYEKKEKEIYVSVNLDDGYMDNYLYAYHVLKKYKVPATIFLTTDYIGKNPVFWWDRVFNATSYNEHATDRINAALRTEEESEIQRRIKEMEDKASLLKKAKSNLMLGWEEIRKMKEDGIDFGSHTKTHRNLCLLSDEEVAEELGGSKKVLEENLGEEVRGFSYPFGIYDERIKNLAKRAGFGYARAGFKGFNHKNADRFALASICAGPALRTSFLADRISLSAFKTH
ncbi:MAG: polysaccharide deacetylase family protein [Candidatus Omnitrophica bacterium]|nr:polysaccharide deacetylase family protein [Candidatus Omnitrophota bacterium]